MITYHNGHNISPICLACKVEDDGLVMVFVIDTDVFVDFGEFCIFFWNARLQLEFWESVE